MKINYILSDTTKGATTEALKSVIEKAERDVFGTYVVLVPETKSIIIEKELLSLSKNGAFANIYVYSFVRLINRLGFVSADKIVSKQTCVMLLRKIIFDNLKNLKCYQKTAKAVGFAEKIYDTIQQFKSSNVTVDDLKNSNLNCSNALKMKLEDIILLYDEYEKVLAGKFYDDCDKLNLLGKFAKDNEFVKSSEFFVVGFDNVTYEMTSVLKDLAINSKEITFSSVFFNNSRKDAYLQNNDLYNKFRHIADSLKIPYFPKFVPTKKNADFHAVQNYLFSTEQCQVKSLGNIEVFEAKSKKHEIDEIANKILFEIKAGKRFRDIGLYATNVSENVSLIEKCFDSYGIPYFINEEHDISTHPLLKFLQSCFELVIHHLSSEKVLKFLASPFVGCDDFAMFENYVNETGLNYNAFLETLNKSDFEDDKTFEQINNVLVKFQNFYGEFSSMLKNSAVAEDCLSAIEFILEYFDAKNVLDQISAFEKDNGFEIESEISSAIYDKCLEFNKTFANFMGGVEVSIEEFVMIYLSGFKSTKLNLAPVSIDSVIVQDNTDGFFGIKDLFILGAEDGKFPAKIQDSGIILDAELEEVKSLVQKHVEPTVKDINSRELFRVYDALLEPTEKLFVSYSLKNIDGSQNKPARMILRLYSLFGEELKRINYNHFPFANKTGYEMRFARHVNEYLNGEFDYKTLNKEYSILKNNLSLPYKNHLENLNFGETVFQIDSASEIFFTKNKTSISQLETYFSCPYSYFATYGLRLKENKNAKLSSLDIGSIIHRIVELFVNQIKSFENKSESDFEKQVFEIISQTFSELKVNTNHNKAVLKFIEKESLRLCKYLFYEQQNSSFKAKYNEFSFTGENAVKIQIDSNTVISIEGKIDRVDEFGDYIRIIDYKTGDIKSDLSASFYGKKIQLVSYLLATDHFENKDVAGLFYFPIHSEFVKNDEKIEDIYKLQGFLIDDADVLKHMDNRVSFDNPQSSFIPFKIKTGEEFVNTNTFEISKGRKKIYFSKDEFDSLKKYNSELCKIAISEILDGFIEPSPISLTSQELPCKWCELSGFCGLEKARFKTGRECSGDVTMESFIMTTKEGADD